MSETDPLDFPGEPAAAENRKPKPGASSSGGAGRFEGSEARIASIEAHVDHMRDDIGDMRLDLRDVTKTVSSVGAEMREVESELARLPGRGWITFMFILAAAAICAVIIYLEQIRQYLGLLLPMTTP